MIFFVPLHTLGHGGIVWCGTQWLVCLVWYGMVGMPGMPPSLWCISNINTARGIEMILAIFLSGSNSLKIALVTCCCCGNSRNSETSAMSGGFTTKGQCWSGLPWKWLQVLGGLSWSICWLFSPIYPLQTRPGFPTHPFTPRESSEVESARWNTVVW